MVYTVIRGNDRAVVTSLFTGRRVPEAEEEVVLSMLVLEQEKSKQGES